MKNKLLSLGLLALLVSTGVSAKDHHKKHGKKDHSNLTITCTEFIDYEPAELTSVYYWFDAYSWTTWGDSYIMDDYDYGDWYANVVTYCTNNKGELVYEAIDELY